MTSRTGRDLTATSEPWAAHFETDRAGVIRAGSGEVASVLGVEADAVAGRHLSEVLQSAPPITWEGLWSSLTRPTESRVHALCYVVTPDGSERPVEVRCARAGADGSLRVDVLLLTPAVPVDDLAALCTWHSPAGQAIAEPGRVVFANPAMERALGFAPGALGGTSDAELGLFGEDARHWQDAVVASLEGSPVAFGVGVGAGEGRRWYDGAVVPLVRPDGTVERFGVYAHDVTAHVRRTDGLAAENRVLRARLAQGGGPGRPPSSAHPAGSALAELDADGYVQAVNEQFCALYDAGEWDLVGRQVADLFTPEDGSALRVHARRLRTDELDVVSLTATITPVSGGPRTVRAALTALRDEGRAFVGAVLRVLPAERALSLVQAPTSEVSALRNRVAELERAVHRFGAVLDDVAPGRRAVASSRWWAEGSRLDQLSTREVEIVGHLVDGLRPPSIARLMHVSPSTIRNHLSSIFRKLGVASQEELLVLLRTPRD